MPIELDGYDVSILKSLFEDGRKSFRQVSRETGITIPTVKARFERMVNVGFIKGVLPVIDYARVKNSTTISELPAYNQNQHIMKIKKGMKIMLDCDLCRGTITGNAQILKFADYERFFCCNSCKSEYKKKYGGRIEAIEKRYNE